MFSTKTAYPSVGRKTPFYGNEEFSDFMYGYQKEANNGFTYCDIDSVLRNYHKETIGILEIKKMNGKMTVCQDLTFNVIHEFLKTGNCGNWKYVGFFLLQFSHTNWQDSEAVTMTDLKGHKAIMTEERFKYFLNRYF
jgi:hypothetical protein